MYVIRSGRQIWAGIHGWADVSRRPYLWDIVRRYKTKAGAQRVINRNRFRSVSVESDIHNELIKRGK